MTNESQRLVEGQVEHDGEMLRAAAELFYRNGVLGNRGVALREEQERVFAEAVAKAIDEGESSTHVENVLLSAFVALNNRYSLSDGGVIPDTVVRHVMDLAAKNLHQGDLPHANQEELHQRLEAILGQTQQVVNPAWDATDVS